MTPRRKRMLLAGFIVLGVSLAAGLVLTAFRQNLMYFYTPSEVASGKAPTGRNFRIGGLVATGSVQRAEDSLKIHFKVTDTKHAVPVVYSGILPDLFREGQGIVVNGRLRKNGVFKANQVLAKHDENYMPPEATEALKTAGAKSPNHPMDD